MADNTASSGAGCLGAIIAAVLSYALNGSLFWMLVHAFCSWFYVLYALIVRSREIVPALRVMFGL